MNLNIKKGNTAHILKKRLHKVQHVYTCDEAIFVLLQQVKSLNGLTELICWACRLVCNVSYIAQICPLCTA